MAVEAPPRATREQKDRLISDFIRLCETESPSYAERGVCDLIRAELAAVGISCTEDRSYERTGSDTGNLLARIDGPEGARTICLCAHMDTVPLAAPVEVAQDGEVLQNRHPAILGADNKEAVAVILSVARALAQSGAPVGVELLFTTCEEQALLGAKSFDTSLLRSDYGFVFDHASPIGELIVAAPTYYRVGASFHGTAAHAGIRPEDGHNAIAACASGISSVSFGRLDAETTANVGTISGGTAPNVVAERCDAELEVRSLDHAKATARASEIVDAMTRAASDAGCDVETEVEEKFRGYSLSRSSDAVVCAQTSLEGLGISPSYVKSGGGSDVNVWQAKGLCFLNIADGSQRNHQPDEQVTVSALETMLDVALALVHNSA